MDTVTVKTSELIGPALDWAVDKAERWWVGTRQLAVSKLTPHH